jgi:phage tail-like protein
MALDQFDNAPAYNFSVTIDGVQMPLVMEVSGVKMEVDKIEAKQQVAADGKYVARQIPGRGKTGEITITRGLTDSRTIVDWLKTVMEAISRAPARPPRSTSSITRARPSRRSTSRTAGCGR